MTFQLGQKSKLKLAGVHSDLVAVVERAIHLSRCDFAVTEGLRTLERQKQLVAKGKSKTLDSRHLKGCAVDLAAYVNGAISWEFSLYPTIAEAMRQAARELKVHVVWGCVWDRPLSEFQTAAKDEVEAYKARRKQLGRKAFLDGPHFELDRRYYP